MTNIKKMITVGTLGLAICATSFTALAASNYQTPAEAVAGITGRTVESVVSEKVESGKTYGMIASDAGKLDEFRSEVLEIKKDNLNTQVAAGRMTQEQADAIIQSLEENQAICDGTGKAKIGKSFGARFGSNGTGLGTGGANCGTGIGRGQGGGGRGMGAGGLGLQDGSCYTTVN
jgi:hypothetical protein